MKKEIKQLLKKIHLQKIGQEQFIADINRDYCREQKKILLCYLDYQRTIRELSQGFGHTNRLEMMQMIHVCIQNDWCIDVCACYDTDAFSGIRTNYYDYILGFGETFKYARQRNPQAKAILYMTENPYTISYARESERLAYFKERTGRSFSLERTGVYYKENDEQNCDAILCLGDTKYFERTGKDFIRIYPSAPKNSFFSPDYSHKKKTSFLVFGVDGFIHKGNDILIEVFTKHPEWTLYLCGGRGEEKAKEAGYTLPANVKALGFIDPLSERFADIVAECYFLLLPSCSEALSTAVLNGMRHGVLPVVSKGIGLDDFTDYCRYFDDFHLDSVEHTLSEICTLDEKMLQAQSLRMISYADEHFSLEKYSESFAQKIACLTSSN